MDNEHKADTFNSLYTIKKGVEYTLKPEELAELNSATKYPKIQTLWERNSNWKVISGKLNPKLEALKNIRKFILTEKYDGTNLGIVITPEKEVYVRKRSTIIARWLGFNSGDILARFVTIDQNLNNIKYYLNCFKNIDFNSILKWFEDRKSLITIFGEGVGKKIQKHSEVYTDDYDFRVFDIKCGNSFFDWKSLTEFCEETRTKHVAYCPFLGDDIIKWDWEEELEEANKDKYFEGYVIRSEPPLLNQYGARMMFKIKLKDFMTEKEKNNWS